MTLDRGLVRNRATALCLAFIAAPGTACNYLGSTSSGAPDASPGTPAELASSDQGAPKRPPPLRVAKPPAPALPDLPQLGRDTPGGPAPENLDGNPCHSVWTGSQTAPLACARALFTGSDKGGAVALVPRKLLSHDVSTLPAVVDHRLEGTEGPVRDQRATPACTAFATAAAIDHALARWGGGNPAVSVMEIWSRYHTPEVVTSLSSNVGRKLGAETQWPFRAPEALAWVSCKEFATPPPEGCGRPVDAARLQAVDSSAIGELTEVEYLGASPSTLVLEEELAAGQDVMVTLEPPSPFVPKGKAGARYVPDYGRSSGSGHSMLIAGYAHFPHGTYFLLHNSWGTAWGDGGYAWIHEITLRRWSKEAVSVDAEPILRGPGSRPLRKRAQTTCAPGLVPDSIQATCTPPCADHGPRHDGVCPLGGQCPAGFVNLTGACVLAAPTVAGKDPATSISWTCGPGGCSYVLPRASDAGCTGATCQASCPAPDFILARMASGDLVCME